MKRTAGYEKKIIKLAAKMEYKNFIDSEEYEEITSVGKDRETIIILEVYDRVWKSMFRERISTIHKDCSVRDLLDMIVDLSREVHLYETELYRLANRTDWENVSDEATNAYAGMVSNLDMEILEIIEEVVLCKN